MKKGARLLTAVTVVALGLAGCATEPPPKTPSGKLEVTLHNVDTDCVRSFLANGLVNAGFNIKTMNNYQLVAERESTSTLATALLGTELSGPPDERTTFTFLPKDNGRSLRIVWTAAYVSNPGTGLESVYPISGSQANEEQLLRDKPKLEAKCAARSNESSSGAYSHPSRSHH